MVHLDEIDRKILSILQDNGRIRNRELANRIGLSPPSALERVKKLEKKGVIKRYVALLNPVSIGKDTVMFVAVSLIIHQENAIEKFTSAVMSLPEVLECYHITGTSDYLLKVAVRDVAAYEEFVLHKLLKIPVIQNIQTSVVLSTVKQNTKFEIS
ncbi:MAG: Lrp/AsnC family transcriptional regulator [Fidelibacterota bacterium]